MFRNLVLLSLLMPLCYATQIGNQSISEIYSHSDFVESRSNSKGSKTSTGTIIGVTLAALFVFVGLCTCLACGFFDYKCFQKCKPPEVPEDAEPPRFFRTPYGDLVENMFHPQPMTVPNRIGDTTHVTINLEDEPPPSYSEVTRGSS